MYAINGQIAPMRKKYVRPTLIRVSLPFAPRYKNKLHTAVNLARREHSHRPDDAPDNTRSTEHLRTWADESILLCRAADVGNIREHPGLYAKLDRPSDYGGDDLGLIGISDPILNPKGDRSHLPQNIERGGIFM